MTEPRGPISTYRLQFNSRFRFEDARTIVPYLRLLGISDIYASPILKARRGSTHGYDVTDPTCLNPELGSEPDFEALAQELKSHEMGLFLDIVPNHMAASTENPWWMDVLEHGNSSPYAPFFDIDWHPPGSVLNDKLLLPILGSPYGQALENQELELKLEDSGLFVYYYDHRLPLNARAYTMIVSHGIDAFEAKIDSRGPFMRRLKQIISDLDTRPFSASADYFSVKEELWSMVNTSPELKAHVLGNVAIFNGKKGEPESFDHLDSLIARQAYRLTFWRYGLENINYRRFFDIIDLVGVRVEDPDVFDATHSLILRLAREGKITGLRVDHIDGLHDPPGYLHRLQNHVAEVAPEPPGLPGFYVVVEKILASDEKLDKEWPVFGTTGYDFLNQLNALFVDWKRLRALKSGYEQFTDLKATFEDVVYQKKNQVVSELFPMEVGLLGSELGRLAQYDRYARDISQGKLKEALVEVTTRLSIYRTYTSSLNMSSHGRFYIERALRDAREKGRFLDERVLDFVRRVLLLEFPTYLAPEQRDAWLNFVMRWQQFTGPIMAKGVEDTALYNYNCLVSLNDVGGEPGTEELSLERFHSLNAGRQSEWPHTMSATSTHDTKRSEDVRARINVLSEIPQEWNERVGRWSRWNEAEKQKVNGLPVPDANAEWLLYQTLVGAWPLYATEAPQFRERLSAYMIKAAREAKAFTSWLSPDIAYEEALSHFIEAILEDDAGNSFMRDFLEFQQRVAFYGAINSLSQTLLKIVSPGAPDFYQGTELWDLSLVDPDNRRPVDYSQRIRLLDDLIDQERLGQSKLVSTLLDSWEDGRIKLYLTHKALRVRNAYKDVFSKGEYIPLKARGAMEDHVCAFARRYEKSWVITIAPRLLAGTAKEVKFPTGAEIWGEDSIIIPYNASRRWFNVLTGEAIDLDLTRNGFRLSTIFSTMPLALLIPEEERDLLI